MHKGIIAACIAGALFFSAASASALQCVPYARDISGISLSGNAWTWWSAAAGRYDRGQSPIVGSVLVFKQHGSMRYGHVAVVRSQVNSREIRIDHANWGSSRIGGRGSVATDVSVIDVSPRNDWTQVKVWNHIAKDFGTKVYPAYGFIYAEAPVRLQAKLVVQSRQALPIPVVAKPSAPQPVLQHEDPAEAPAKDKHKTEAKKTEPKAAPEIKTETVAAIPVAAESPVNDDDALAKRFGSGRYRSSH
ncbi:MAG: CHAP domain-containing protein [Rhodospirillaceae bacterium]|nr:CHAP domain-containing protein [Rhodospirillaceae bacterium]